MKVGLCSLWTVLGFRRVRRKHPPMRLHGRMNGVRKDWAEEVMWTTQDEQDSLGLNVGCREEMFCSREPRV